MTCIIGLEHEGSVYMGGDSAAICDWDVSTEANPKVFLAGEFIIGYAWSFRMGQLLQYHLSVKPQEQETDRAYMVLVVAEAVRKLMVDSGYARVRDNEEEGGAFLIGYRGKVYRMQGDWSVLRHTDGFETIGCGAPYARGALEALDKTDPGKAILRALEIAAHCSSGVRGPFTILKLEP